MIDPKRVELTLYHNIPHLLTPIIGSAREALSLLQGAAKEMERRYDLLVEARVRDIRQYNEQIRQNAKTHRREGLGPMPYIVFIIDELADIMMVYPKETERLIVKLAQMSRAVGIHLILSTQRPSIKVMTGFLKANIPAKIALRVASHIDSQVILDMPGAEDLLGAGDMLYLVGDMLEPTRGQIAFISEKEVADHVATLANKYENAEWNESSRAPALTTHLAIEMAADDDYDDMYERAKEEVIRAGKSSTSLLQRRLGIGYGRATRLLKMLEQRGVVGPVNDTRRRHVIDNDTAA